MAQSAADRWPSQGSGQSVIPGLLQQVASNTLHAAGNLDTWYPSDRPWQHPPPPPPPQQQVSNPPWVQHSAPHPTATREMQLDINPRAVPLSPSFPAASNRVHAFGTAEETAAGMEGGSIPGLQSQPNDSPQRNGVHAQGIDVNYPPHMLAAQAGRVEEGMRADPGPDMDLFGLPRRPHHDGISAAVIRNSLTNRAGVTLPHTSDTSPHTNGDNIHNPAAVIDAASSETLHTAVTALPPTVSASQAANTVATSGPPSPPLQAIFVASASSGGVLQDRVPPQQSPGRCDTIDHDDQLGRRVGEKRRHESMDETAVSPQRVGVTPGFPTPSSGIQLEGLDNNGRCPAQQPDQGSLQHESCLRGAAEAQRQEDADSAMAQVDAVLSRYQGTPNRGSAPAAVGPSSASKQRKVCDTHSMAKL